MARAPRCPASQFSRVSGQAGHCTHAAQGQRSPTGMARAPLRLVRATRHARHAPDGCEGPHRRLWLCSNRDRRVLNERSGVAALRVATLAEIHRLLHLRFAGDVE